MSDWKKCVISCKDEDLNKEFPLPSIDNRDYCYSLTDLSDRLSVPQYILVL